MPVPEARLRQLRDLLARTAIEGAGGIPYYLHDLLGEGGQGWVYRASYDEPDGPWVVVKLLRPDVVTDESLARFLREADVLRKLGQASAPCPSVVRFYDHGIFRYTMPDGETYALPFTVLEHVNGTTLADVISQAGGKGLSTTRVRRLFRQIARALSVIHAAQIVHRDLKPSNLLLANDAGQEVMKLTDFGLVKRFDIDVKGTVQLAGASIGYAPPEQFEAGNTRVSSRTDLFSFAAVLFEALTSTPAFPAEAGDNPFQVLSRVLSGARPKLSESLALLAPELAERRDLVALLDVEIERALSPDPGDRHGSVKELWDHLDPIFRAVVGAQPGGTLKFAAQGGPETSGARPSAYRHPAEARPSVAAPATAGTPSPQRMEPSGQRPASAALPGFHVVAAVALPDRARVMSLAPDGRSGCALVRHTLHRFDGAVWSVSPIDPALDLGRMHGVLAMPGGETLLFGEQGALVAVAADGTFVPWAPPDPDVSWTAASLTPAEIVLLGEVPGQRGSVLGSLRRGQPLLRQRIDSSARLHGLARLASGALLACGDGGELLHVFGNQVSTVSWGRTGHLFAIAATADGGAYVVGSGGHALWVTPSLEAKLEPVQTTRDLYAVAVSPGGTGWAGGGGARLVRRGRTGWARVALPGQVTGAIRALHATPTGAVAALDDGMVIDGGIF